MAEDRRDPVAEVMRHQGIPARVMDGEEVAETEDEVDLMHDHRLLAVEREQDDVDDPVRRLDLGPLVALEDVLDDERVQSEDLADRFDLLRRGRRHIDPHRRLGLAQQPGKGLQRGIALIVASGPVDDA